MRDLVVWRENGLSFLECFGKTIILAVSIAPSQFIIDKFIRKTKARLGINKLCLDSSTKED